MFLPNPLAKAGISEVSTKADKPVNKIPEVATAKIVFLVIKCNCNNI
jgi:hypothetical protein